MGDFYFQFAFLYFSYFVRGAYVTFVMEERMFFYVFNTWFQVFQTLNDTVGRKSAQVQLHLKIIFPFQGKALARGRLASAAWQLRTRAMQ